MNKPTVYLDTTIPSYLFEEREELQTFVQITMPRKLEGDARHLAFASLYQMKFLLTWNCNHLANGNKKHHIQVINARLQLPVPEILTPLELFKETIP